MAVTVGTSERAAGDRTPFSVNIGRRSPSTAFVHGEVDLGNAPSLAAAVRLVLDQRPERLTLDFSDAKFTDCSGVAVIADALRETPDGFEVIIRHPRPFMQKVLEILDIDGPWMNDG